MTARADEFRRWCASVSGPEWYWFAKYVSANDTYAKSNVHQAGPYVGKDLLRAAFPQLTVRATKIENPDLRLPVSVVSHDDLPRPIRLVWYNSAVLEARSNGRNEARMTGWGGRDHPLVSDSATGSLALFAFHQSSATVDADACQIWIAETAAEEDEIQAAVGPVEPGRGIFARAAGLTFAASTPTSRCALRADEIRAEWALEMPSGEDIVSMVLTRAADARKLSPDARLLSRRDCEFELFRSLEEHLVGPRVRTGFASVEEFVGFAHSVTNRRKARAGRSLELHTRALFDEDSVPHSWTERTEEKRTPDFIFPSIGRYHDKKWPAAKLRMLAAKTTCKDRWRQILNEADRIRAKHLLTLQEGVSEPQYREMKSAHVRLVVPSGLHKHYPPAVRAELMSVADFIAEVTGLGS